MRRSLRPWHLLLLVPLLVASTPAKRPAQASLAGTTLEALRVRFPSPPVVGTWTPFTVTAIDKDNLVFQGYTGIVDVTVTGPQAGVQPPFHLFISDFAGVAPFEARWPVPGVYTVTARERGGTVFTVHTVEVPGPATRLAFELPLSAPAGAPVTGRVVAYDAGNNVARGFNGAIRFESSDPRATVPRNVTLNQGSGSFTFVFFSAGGQIVRVHDASGSGLTSTDDTITVVPGPIQSFELSSSDNTPMAGEQFFVQLVARDAYDNQTFDPSQTLQFSSTDPAAELPVGVRLGTEPYPIILKTAGRQDISVSISNGARGTLAGLEVSPGAFHEVRLSPPTTQAVDICTAATVELRAVDLYGNAVPYDEDVLLCGTPGQALSFVESTLEDVSPGNAGCIVGDLPPSGVGLVRWSSRDPGPVVFEVNQATARTVTLTWQDQGISPANSRISFPGAPRNPPLLRTFTATQPVLFEPRNACGVAVDPPTGQTLNIAVQSPLVRIRDAEREERGRWTTEVRLPKCPDTGAAPLKLGPTLNGEPLQLPNNAGPLYAEILPNCLPPDVLLELVARPKDAKATPGAEVQFELTLSNTGGDIIPAGRLWLEAESLTVLEASLDGEKLETSSMKLSIPELAPGAVRTVKLKGLAGVQLDVPVMLSAWYTTLEDTALTEQKAVSLEWDELAANVGCGCQTGALPSQFLPWLALLAVASRARARLRRLTRGERIDR
ncbi:MAG TPA: hypothetical protein VK539_28045 [Myxococcaceae bacterium]|nr:hypothetical protein [Myxococcaceae bacterium]